MFVIMVVDDDIKFIELNFFVKLLGIGLVVMYIL